MDDFVNLLQECGKVVVVWIANMSYQREWEPIYRECDYENSQYLMTDDDKLSLRKDAILK